MANWWNNVTKQYIPQTSPTDMRKRFGGSFVDNDGNAQTEGDFNFNPNVSTVIDKPTKYWTGTTVVSLISQSQRNAIDTQESEDSKDQLVNGSNDREKASYAELLSLINELRAKNGDADITGNEFKADVRSRM